MAVTTRPGLFGQLRGQSGAYALPLQLVHRVPLGLRRRARVPSVEGVPDGPLYHRLIGGILTGMLAARYLRLFGLLASFAAAQTLTGCGWMFTGTEAEVPIESSPGAYVWVDGRYVGATPLTVRLDSSEDHFIVIARDGLPPVQVEVTSSLQAGWLVLDILLLPLLVPIIVDAATGGWFDVDQSHVRVQLAPGPAGPPPTDEWGAPPTPPSQPPVPQR